MEINCPTCVLLLNVLYCFVSYSKQVASWGTGFHALCLRSESCLRYDNNIKCLSCARKLMDSQLNLPHWTPNGKMRKEELKHVTGVGSGESETESGMRLMGETRSCFQRQRKVYWKEQSVVRNEAVADEIAYFVSSGTQNLNSQLVWFYMVENVDSSQP